MQKGLRGCLSQVVQLALFSAILFIIIAIIALVPGLSSAAQAYYSPSSQNSGSLVMRLPYYVAALLFAYWTFTSVWYRRIGDLVESAIVVVVVGVVLPRIFDLHNFGEDPTQMLIGYLGLAMLGLILGKADIGPNPGSSGWISSGGEGVDPIKKGQDANRTAADNYTNPPGH